MQISAHETRVYRALADHLDRWFTRVELAVAASVATRTASQHARDLAQRGIVEQIYTVPFRYRITGDSLKQDPAYVQELENARLAYARRGEAAE